MAKRGGWRGGGRPKGSKNKSTYLQEEAKQQLIASVMDDWGKVITTTKMLAFGEIYEGKIITKDGVEQIVPVAKIKPDQKALQSLIEHVVGKPKETIDMTNPEGNKQIHELTSLIRTLLLPKRMKHDKTP